MNKKHLHVIVKYFYPVTAGIETNTLETYSVLAEKGWDITIHTSRDTAVEKNCLRSTETFRGLKIKRYPFTWYGFLPQISTKNADIIALHNFDIFPHLHMLAYYLILKILGKKNFSLVLTPHGGFNPEWRVFGKIKGFIKQTYHNTLGVFLINHVVDAIRTVSEWEKKEMLGKGIRKNIIHVITNGIENEAYMDVDKLASPAIKKKVKKFGKYIIQVGRIYMIKNYETAIRALVHTPKDIKFVMAGAADKNPSYKKTDYLDTLKKLVTELKLEDRVIFVGVVRGADKYYLIKHAEMMVHMALWESYCNVVHEGMSQGLVCLVANNTALPLLIKDKVNGYVINTTDEKTLARKIQYVLKNKNTKTMKSMSQLNRTLALENSWRNVAEKVDMLYTTLIEKIEKKQDRRFARSKFVKIYLSR